MLYMVIERFRGGDPGAVGARFRERGRLIPEGSGVEYVSSWMGADGAVCYQLMEAPGRAALDGWIAAWADLVEFEVVEVVASAEYWSGRRV
jgi:hypothetical protein